MTYKLKTKPVKEQSSKDSHLKEDAMQCLKPVLTILENALIPSTAVDSRDRIRNYFIYASITATKESRREYELKCKREKLNHVQRHFLLRKCIRIIYRWELEVDAWVKVSSDYHYFQEELEDFKIDFSIKFNTPYKEL